MNLMINKSEDVYVRKLSPTEIRRRFIYVSKKNSTFFPKIGIPFRVRINGDKLDCKLDAYYRIWMDVRIFSNIKLGDSIKLIKYSDETYSLIVVKNGKKEKN